MTTPLFAKARRHLGRRDPVLKQLIASIGPCTLRYHSDRFALLVRSIISQQISSKAAIAIGGRLKKLLGASRITPAGILSVSLDELRSAGLSEAKARSVRDLAE